MMHLAFYLLNIEINRYKDLDKNKVYELILCHGLGEIKLGDITPFDNYDLS